MPFLRPLRFSFRHTGCLFVLLVAIFFGCGDFHVSEFNPNTNITLSDNMILEVVWDSTYSPEGTVIPNNQQSDDGYFHFSFQLQGDSSRKYYYKIYYQNEEFKFPEAVGDQPDSMGECNFYGSWGDGDEGFRCMPPGSLTHQDRFRIIGNPRNERKFFGKPMANYVITDSQVDSMIKLIETMDEWYRQVQTKASSMKVSMKQQLESDAIYTLMDSRNHGPQNHRWKRNPMLGWYSALLVVCSEDEWRKLPEYIQDVTLKREGHYVNPYYYFLHGPGARRTGIHSVLYKNFVKLYSERTLPDTDFVALKEIHAMIQRKPEQQR